MSAQNATIQLDPKTAEALAAYAAGFGLSIADFLKRHYAGTNGVERIDDADRWLDELCEGSELLPPLPRDFSTRDIYADHD